MGKPQLSQRLIERETRPKLPIILKNMWMDKTPIHIEDIISLNQPLFYL